MGNAAWRKEDRENFQVLVLALTNLHEFLSVVLGISGGREVGGCLLQAALSAVTEKAWLSLGKLREKTSALVETSEAHKYKSRRPPKPPK